MLEDPAARVRKSTEQGIIPQRNCHGDGGGGVRSRDRFSSSSIFFV
jgi:hypothetical protein